MNSMTLKFIKSSLFKKLLLSALISICLLHTSPAAALDVFDLFLIKSIKDFNDPLIKRIEQVDFDNSILIISKIKEILRGASNEDLADVLRTVERLSAFKIKLLIDSEIKKRASPSILSEFNYYDRAILGVRPIEDASCNKVGGKCYLSGLNPERDSLDLPDLELGRTSTVVAPEVRSPELPQTRQGEKDVLNRAFDDQLEFLWKHSPAKTPSIKFRLKLWSREYQESELYPAHTHGKVFIQNTNRIECLDALSGEVKWTFSPSPHNGYDEKLIMRSNLYDKQPPYYIAAEDDAVYAELVNQFIKLDVSLDKPKARWRVPLGAYSLASKPYIVGDRIFIALINGRGELWGAMLDKENGILLWSTYVALVTQVCPSSDLITHDDTTLYFVTNRGLSVAFSLAQGSVKWLLEYPIRQYRITDIWKNDGEFWRFTEEPYTTSWVSVDKDVIVMKPRDSDIVYFGDKNSGKELAHFYLEDITFLMSENTMAFFLKDGIVSAVNIMTGEQVKIGRAPGAHLRGVLYDPVKKECLIKVDRSLFLLQPHNDTARFTQLKSTLSDEGWLRGLKGEDIYFDCSKDSITRYGLKVSRIAGKNEAAKDPGEMTRSSPAKEAPKKQHAAPSVFMEDKSQDDFVLAEGEKIRSLAVRYDSPDFPYFLTVKNDVLICSSKTDAQVIWTKRLMGFCKPRYFGSLRLNLILSAALYGEILVVFDGINLFGVDATSGEIRWAVNIQTENMRELFLYQSMVTSQNKAYLFDALFSPDSIVYFSKGSLYFIDPKTGRTRGVVHTKHPYITGLKREGPYLMCGYLFDKKVALYDYQKRVLIKELDVQEAVPDSEKHEGAAMRLEDVAKRQKNEGFSMAFQYPHCYLQVASGLWSFNFKTEKIVHRAGEFAAQKDWSVSVVDREIVSFNPLWKIVIWDEGLKKIKKKIPFSSKSYDDSMRDTWQYIAAVSQLWSLKEATFIHSTGSILVCPVKESGGVYVVGIDVQKGIQLWKIFVTDFYPKIWHMSNSVVTGDVICFTLSVKAQSQDWVGDDGYVDTTFMAIDVKKGIALKRLRFPQGMSWGRYTHYLSSVGNNVLVNENDERIRVLRIRS